MASDIWKNRKIFCWLSKCLQKGLTEFDHLVKESKETKQSKTNISAVSKIVHRTLINKNLLLDVVS